MNNCIKCNKEFESVRKDAKFCSDKCKMAYHRDVTDKSVTDNVTDKSLFNVVGESWKQTDGSIMKMYECDVHREHCEKYCLAMCTSECKHTLKDE